MGANFGLNFLRKQASAQGHVMITIVIIKLNLWPAASCEAKVGAELSFRPLTFT